MLKIIIRKNPKPGWDARVSGRIDDESHAHGIALRWSSKGHACRVWRNEDVETGKIFYQVTRSEGGLTERMPSFGGRECLIFSHWEWWKGKPLQYVERVSIHVEPVGYAGKYPLAIDPSTGRVA